MSKLLWQCTYDDCQAPRVGNAKYCHTHLKGFEKMARDVKKTAEKKAVPLNKVSDKRKEQNALYLKMLAKWLPGKRCEVCRDNGIKRDAQQCHHKKGRENDLLLEQKYWLPVCSECHRFITDNSAWAIQEGYSLPRNQKI